jgi:hypothetical protein
VSNTDCAAARQRTEPIEIDCQGGWEDRFNGAIVNKTDDDLGPRAARHVHRRSFLLCGEPRPVWDHRVGNMRITQEFVNQ